MRIRGKLLATYLILIGVLGGVAALALPRWVERTVRINEQQRLEKQAQLLADRIADQTNPRKNPAPRLTDRTLLDFLVDQSVAIVDEHNRVIVSTNPAYKNVVLTDKCAPATSAPPRRATARAPLRLEGVGDIVYACAPINSDLPLLQGHSVLVVRELSFIQNMAKPIAREVLLMVAVGLIASMIIAAWFSRTMVKRLEATGAAARALAEGDLSQRAPEEGTDEITELAEHFNHMAERLQALVNGLRRSETARKDLLVTVSHELRTPMTSIAGFAEALRDGVVQGDDRRQRYYESIASEATRLNRLISDLFDVSKLETGQLELRMQAMPIAAWLVEFVEGFKPVADAGQIQLELDMTPEAEFARIYGDQDRLDQVLNNLAGNAVRYSPPGQTIRIRASTDGDDVVISVTDQGPGIPPEEAAHVFERFFQGANKGNGNKGAGLGLAIVKSLVEAHGGQVGVASTPGQGTTFWFRIKRLTHA